MRNIFIFLFLFTMISAKAQNKDAYDVNSLNNGELAPDIIGVDHEGAVAQLSKVNSPFTLLYIYEPGCGHCDKILPVLINLYNEYKGKGMQVFAVPTMNNKEKWLEMIAKNHLTWLDVYLEENNLKGLRKDYKIYSVPTLYLLDRNKKVLGKRLRIGDEVEDALKKYIK